MSSEKEALLDLDWAQRKYTQAVYDLKAAIRLRDKAIEELEEMGGDRDFLVGDRCDNHGLSEEMLTEIVFGIEPKKYVKPSWYKGFV